VLELESKSQLHNNTVPSQRMKLLKSLSLLLFSAVSVMAQTDDPIIMKINGKPISRSEFEYSYNKSNSDNMIDRKTIEEYADLFISYKLKVEEALAAQLDTLSTIKSELSVCRAPKKHKDPTVEVGSDIEARHVYDEIKTAAGSKGLIKLAHIFIYVEQKAPNTVFEAARRKTDSLYFALQRGADFALLAREHSQDSTSAAKGGELPWIQSGQTFAEFEAAAWALKPGEISKPVLSPAGFHIIQLKERKQFEPYCSMKAELLKMIENRKAREQIVSGITVRTKETANRRDLTADMQNKKNAELKPNDLNQKYLMKEYHDELIVYELCNRTIWAKAASDEVGQKAFFKKNKKRYYWTEPRFKGMVFHVRNEQDIQAVETVLKKTPFNRWEDVLRSTFNNDTVQRVYAEKGMYKKGDNAFIDKLVFKMETEVSPIEGFPIAAIHGKLLKKKPDDYEDVKALVMADYQEEQEKLWVKELRSKYRVEVFKNVLKTVNNHNK